MHDKLLESLGKQIIQDFEPLHTKYYSEELFSDFDKDEIKEDIRFANILPRRRKSC